MTTATEFTAYFASAHGHHAHRVAVFFAKLRLRAQVLGFRNRHHTNINRMTCGDGIIDPTLNRRDLLTRQTIGMVEVEA